MKTKFKIFIALMLFCIMMLSLTVFASAEENADSQANDTTDASANAEADTYDPDNTVSFFEKAFREIKKYATEIFCALTFIGSMILTYAYKKGLLPLIESALLSIGNSVSKIKEKTDANEENTINLGNNMTERLERSEEIISTLTERIEEMTSTIEEVKDGELLKNRENQNLTVIISAQIDMLYDIFMSSALPQYQKDAVGERVALMKEALRGNEEK